MKVRDLELTRKSSKLLALLGVPAYRRALFHGVAAAVEHETVPFDPATRTVIDVGAGRGQFALLARQRFPRALIVGFEPLPASFEKASAVLAPDQRTELRPFAIGAEAGTRPIHVTADADSSSLLRPTAEQQRLFPGTEEAGSTAVEVRSLDEAIDQVEMPGLLKLDVQGGELDALRGASRVLTEVGEVFVECSFVELYQGQPLADEIIVCMAGAGFVLRGMYGPTYGDAGQCVQADLHFTTANDATR
jgi:FkbM family methyltransferase